MTVEEFRLRFPEFADPVEYPDGRIQIFIDDATCFIGTDPNRWCGQCKYNMALAYLVAHLLSRGTATEAGDTTANAGPITGKTAGGVSVTRGYAATSRSDGDDFYMTTAYGQQFLVIRNSCFVGIRTYRYGC